MMTHHHHAPLHPQITFRLSRGFLLASTGGFFLESAEGLNEDLKMNGQVLVEKGSEISGVVRSVKSLDAGGQARSMLEIEWLAPQAQGAVASDLVVTVQSFTQVSPLYRSAEESPDFGFGGAASSAGSASARGGGLLGGSLGAVSSATGTLGGAVGGIGNPVGAAGSIVSLSGSVAGQAEGAGLGLGSVAAVDQQTSNALRSGLGLSGESQMFRTGHGETISATGSRQTVELYSRLDNDTVFASGRDFEVSSGAQMQLLVGVRSGSNE